MDKLTLYDYTLLTDLAIRKFIDKNGFTDEEKEKLQQSLDSNLIGAFYLPDIINTIADLLCKIYGKNESNEILNYLNEKEFNICMDISGKEYTSVELSKLIDNTFTSGYGNITFIIGGSDGINELVKNKCNMRLSFSKLTFPHGLFRGILLEQIYRSFKILNNESYHK